MKKVNRIEWIAAWDWQLISSNLFSQKVEKKEIKSEYGCDLLNLKPTLKISYDQIAAHFIRIHRLLINMINLWLEEVKSFITKSHFENRIKLSKPFGNWRTCSYENCQIHKKEIHPECWKQSHLRVESIMIEFNMNSNWGRLVSGVTFHWADTAYYIQKLS